MMSDEPRKSRVPIFFLGAFSGCLIVFFGMVFIGLMVMASRNGQSGSDVFSTQKVAIIPIDGEIPQREH